MTRRIVTLALGFASLAGCDQRTASRPAAVAVSARLAPGTAALVGQSEIPLSLVADVARASHLAPRSALDRLIADALAAEAAQASGQDRDPDVAWALVAADARAVTERVRQAAHAAGPPTNAEVTELTQKYWRLVDLPEQVKVVHAVVLRPKEPTKFDAARALAAQLATALSAAKSEDAFDATARATPAGAFEIRVEHLPAFVVDGRTAEGEPISFETSFTRAAFSLKRTGETSGVVESSFGWHVIRLIERRPPKTAPFEERRVEFGPEIYAHRGHAALDATLTARRASTPVVIVPGVDALMALVPPPAP